MTTNHDNTKTPTDHIDEARLRLERATSYVDLLIAAGGHEERSGAGLMPNTTEAALYAVLHELEEASDLTEAGIKAYHAEKETQHA